jgi:hypothetical protein
LHLFLWVTSSHLESWKQSGFFAVPLVFDMSLLNLQSSVQEQSAVISSSKTAQKWTDFGLHFFNFHCPPQAANVYKVTFWYLPQWEPPPWPLTISTRCPEMSSSVVACCRLIFKMKARKTFQMVRIRHERLCFLWASKKIIKVQHSTIYIYNYSNIYIYYGLAFPPNFSHVLATPQPPSIAKVPRRCSARAVGAPGCWWPRSHWRTTCDAPVMLMGMANVCEIIEFFWGNWDVYEMLMGCYLWNFEWKVFNWCEGA